MADALAEFERTGRGTETETAPGPDQDGIFLFTAASVLCGVATLLWLLIFARAARGLGAAGMMTLAMAFVGETVPKARTGSAMGLLGTMSSIGTALGTDGRLARHQGCAVITCATAAVSRLP